eukprot:1131262-Pyramimonas_sp.AAC.1
MLKAVSTEHLTRTRTEATRLLLSNVPEQSEQFALRRPLFVSAAGRDVGWAVRHGRSQTKALIHPIRRNYTKPKKSQGMQFAPFQAVSRLCYTPSQAPN